MLKLLLWAPLLLVACASAGERTVGLDQVSATANCTQSSALDSFKGRVASAELGAQMMAAARARNLRWAPYGGVITMDYSPTRLTVRLDQQNRVESATCG